MSARKSVPPPAPPAPPVMPGIAVIIPAKNESGRIARTIRASRLIGGVDLILVVDDGSTDPTQKVARDAGAVVVRHSHNRGKAEAMETGAAVVAMRDAEDGPSRLLLFLDADLGDSAANAADLVTPVRQGTADVAVAILPAQPGDPPAGVVRMAARSVQRATGWTPQAPLSGIRCLTRQAFDAVTPLSRGWGVEIGMTIDLLARGFRLQEVACDLRHRNSGSRLGGTLHRGTQMRDIAWAVTSRGIRRVGRRRGSKGATSPALSLPRRDL